MSRTSSTVGAPGAKKKVPTPKPSLTATKGKDVAAVAPRKKKFVPPMMPKGIVIGALAVPTCPYPS